jgi:hypothetical protein
MDIFVKIQFGGLKGVYPLKQIITSYMKERYGAKNFSIVG